EPPARHVPGGGRALRPGRQITARGGATARLARGHAVHATDPGTAAVGAAADAPRRGAVGRGAGSAAGATGGRGVRAGGPGSEYRSGRDAGRGGPNGGGGRLDPGRRPDTRSFASHVPDQAQKRPVDPGGG